MAKYKTGDKFLLEVTGINDIGSRTLYEVNGMSGLFSENVLDRLEKVDAVPVVRGDGIAERERQGTYSHCSICGCRCGGYTPNYNFCPNCGADMRKKVE